MSIVLLLLLSNKCFFFGLRSSVAFHLIVLIVALAFEAKNLKNLLLDLVLDLVEAVSQFFAMGQIERWIQVSGPIIAFMVELLHLFLHLGLSLDL